MEDAEAAGRHLVRARGADVILVAVRELRLLMGVLLILFVTSETWRYVGRLTGPRLGLIMAVALSTTVLLAATGLQRALREVLGRGLARRAAVRLVGEAMTFGLAVTVGFVALGFVTVDRDLVAEWTGAPAAVWASAEIAALPLVLTRSLVQVAAFLGALGALVFAIEAVVDPATRQTLLRDLLEEPTRGAS